MTAASKSCIIFDEVTIGEGCIFCDNTIINSNSKIGNFVHLNTNSAVYHDCIVEDYVTVAPSVGVMGRVHIKESAYIGAGAMIKQGERKKHLTIGEKSIVGMGSIVINDVEDEKVVIGNPAREIKK